MKETFIFLFGVLAFYIIMLGFGLQYLIKIAAALQISPDFAPGL